MGYSEKTEIMEMSNVPETEHFLNDPCKSGACGFSFDWSTGTLNCVAGDGSCISAHFAEAEESKIHDRTLIEATAQLQEVLSKIPADPEGRNLSFVQTPWGLLLAWVNHSDDKVEAGVTKDSAPQTIATALKLKV